MKNTDDYLEFSDDVTVLMQLEPAATRKRLAAQGAAEPVPPLTRVSHQMGGQKVGLRIRIRIQEGKTDPQKWNFFF